jgi:putative membrane protein
MIGPQPRLLNSVFAIWVIALALSAYHPADVFTWFLEIGPVFISMPLMFVTRRSFPLTPLLYVLILIHGLILILGGHYTYAEVPLGFWMQDAFDFSRNHYDRIGHLAQGFIPAILAREVLLRKTDLKPGKMLFYIIVSICLAFSAFYEFLEWGAAVALDSDAEAFLGTQGDVWDSHWDMLMATIGAVLAQVFLAKWHSCQLGDLNKQ